MAGEHIGQRLCGALVGNLREPDRGALFEQLDPEMRKGPDPRRSIGEPMRFRVSQKVRKRCHRERRMRDQKPRHVGDERNRRKVLGRIIGKLVHDRGLRRERRGHHQQRVAVRLGRGRGLGRHQPAGAAAVLDDDRRADKLGHLRSDRAHDNVRRCARREGQQHADGRRGPIRRVRGRCRKKAEHQR